MSEQDTLTAAEVQSLLGISAPTFYRWVKSGRLQGIRVGRRWRFPRAAIEGLLASDGAAQREALEDARALLAARLSRRLSSTDPERVMLTSTDPVPLAQAALRQALAGGASALHVEPRPGG